MATLNITMLRNPAKSLGCPLLEGETGPVESSLATQLVDLKLAVLAVKAEQPKQVQGVPDAPRIMGDEAAIDAPTKEQAEPDDRVAFNKPPKK